MCSNMIDMISKFLKYIEIHYNTSFIGDGVNGIVSENLFFRKTVAILSEICYTICR